MRQNLAEGLIRRKLARYLTKRLSLRAFRNWLVPFASNIDEWGSAPLRELVYEVKLRLAEYTNGHWSEDDLRAKLRPLTTTYHVSFIGDEKQERKPQFGFGYTDPISFSYDPNSVLIRQPRSVSCEGSVGVFG